MTLWLTVYAAGAIAVTIYWTVAGSAFDARQAKRLFPLLTGAAIAGSFLGTLIAGPVSPHRRVPKTLVVIEAALLVAAATLLARLPTSVPPAPVVGRLVRAGRPARRASTSWRVRR